MTHDGTCCQNPLTGTLVAATGDSLWIRPKGSPSYAPPVVLARGGVRAFERGELVGARKRVGAGVGLMAGMMAGGAIGGATACSNCDGMGGLAAPVGAVVGGLVGALAGVVIGAQMPHYAWQQTEVPRQVGVASGQQHSTQLAGSPR